MKIWVGLVLFGFLFGAGFWLYDSSTPVAAIADRDQPDITMVNAQSSGSEEPLTNPSADELLKRLMEYWQTVEDYQCSATSFARKGDESSEVTTQISFKRPEMIRADVISGDTVGSVVTRNAKGVVHAKRGGVLSFFIMTLSADSSLLQNLRGRTLFRADWGSEIEDFRTELESGAVLSRLSDREVDGKAYHVLEAKRPIVEGEGNQQLLFYIDPESFSLKRIQEIEDSTLVRDSNFSEIKINIGLKDEFFTQK